MFDKIQSIHQQLIDRLSDECAAVSRQMSALCSVEQRGEVFTYVPTNRRNERRHARLSAYRLSIQRVLRVLRDWQKDGSDQFRIAFHNNDYNIQAMVAWSQQ